jgi:hypothetical protein
MKVLRVILWTCLAASQISLAASKSREIGMKTGECAVALVEAVLVGGLHPANEILRRLDRATLTPGMKRLVRRFVEEGRLSFGESGVDYTLSVISGKEAVREQLERLNVLYLTIAEVGLAYHMVRRLRIANNLRNSVRILPMAIGFAMIFLSYLELPAWANPSVEYHLGSGIVIGAGITAARNIWRNYARERSNMVAAGEDLEEDKEVERFRREAQMKVKRLTGGRSPMATELLSQLSRRRLDGITRVARRVTTIPSLSVFRRDIDPGDTEHLGAFRDLMGKTVSAEIYLGPSPSGEPQLVMVGAVR